MKISKDKMHCLAKAVSGMSPEGDVINQRIVLEQTALACGIEAGLAKDFVDTLDDAGFLKLSPLNLGTPISSCPPIEISVEQVMTNSLKYPGGVWAASHVHVWNKFLALERGDTLELGGGANSTPFLSSRLLDFEFLTLETSQEWIDTLKTLGAHKGKLHRAEWVQNWDSYDWSKITSKRWKYIFIDHSPGDHRIIEVARLLPFCDFMVIHDTDADRGKGGAYGWSKVEKLPKYWCEYLETWDEPSTSVCSNYYDPEKLVPKF